MGKFYLSVDTTRSQQSRIENVNTVGSHDDLDGLGGLESIQLVEQLKHSPLHFRVTTLPLHARPTNRIHFVNKYDAGRVLPGHDKKLSHHSCSLSDVFLHQL